MPRENWRWIGFAGHLIVSESCLFRLCTDIGDFRVSTIGAYKQPGRAGWTEIGYNRLFETMVFQLGESRCNCGCGEREILSWTELSMTPANTPVEATANHFATCDAIDRDPSCMADRVAAIKELGEAAVFNA